jgi:hypothetical protein
MNRPGIPSTGVDYLRRVVQDGMTDSIRVLRPDIPTYDETTGYATGVSKDDLGYIGPAHVHVAGQSAPVAVGDTVEPMAIIEVTIPFDAAPVPRNEDHLIILSIGALGDAALANESLRIINVSGGGLGFITRTLTCTFEQANPFDTTA